ncbi:Nucleolar protein 9 [Tilletia horrida]|nr:Nucleolar protein 9 [Tilletia horrida]
MPREHKVRQRGKKKSKQQPQEQEQLEAEQDFHNEQQQPSWILSQQEFQQEHGNENGTGRVEGGAYGADAFDESTPFGLVAPEIKSYFKTAYADLVAAAQPQHYAGYDDDGDSQQHTLLLNAALQELSGHELALATDPDTSVVLEYMIQHINPIQLRIFADRFSGSLFTLATHRFGSHVVEAILGSLHHLLSSAAISAPRTPASLVETSESSQGTLRSPSQLIIDYAAELRQGGDEAISTLLHHPFGTHTLRTLLSVLSGHLTGDSTSNIRSKRSAAFRQKEVVSAKGKGKEGPQAQVNTANVPEELKGLLQDVISDLTASLGVNEIRALSHNPVAAPTLGLLLTLEEPKPSENDQVGIAGRLADLLLDEIPTLCAEFQTSRSSKSKKGLSNVDPWELPPTPERSDHMESALRDPIASHLIQGALEAIARRARAFPAGSSLHAHICAAGRLFWRTYILGRTVNLASHPSANYIVQACLALLGQNGSGGQNGADEQGDELRAAIEEIHRSGKKLVKESSTASADSKAAEGGKGKAKEPRAKTENRTGALLALLTRAGRLGPAGGCETDAFQAVLTSFGLVEGKNEDDGEDGADESNVRKPDKKKSSKKKKRKGENGEAVEDENDDGIQQPATKKAATVDPDRLKALLVPCIMSLRTRNAYERMLSKPPGKKSGGSERKRRRDDDDEEVDGEDNVANGVSAQGQAETSLATPLFGSLLSVPGSLLLQVMLRLSPAISEAVYASLLHSSNGPVLLRNLATSAPGTHLLISALGCGQASFKNRVALQRALLEILPDLFKGALGKWGSRIADACWDFADPFFKDKIGAKSLENERVLLASEFGNFFLRRVNVALYRRDPRKWKEEYLKGVERKAFIPSLEEDWRQECASESTTEHSVESTTPSKPPSNANGHSQPAETDAKASVADDEKPKKVRGRKKKRESDTGDDAAKVGEKKVKRQKAKPDSSSLDAILNQIAD